MSMLTITPTIVVHVEPPLSTGGGAPTISWNMPRSWCVRILMLILATCAAFAGQGVASAHAAAGPFELSSSFGVSAPSGGLLDEPRGVAVEASTGDVFVVDSADNRVVKYNAEGTQVLGVVEGGETPAGELAQARVVAVDESSGATKGDVYVGAGKVVDRFKPKGTSGTEPNEYVYECQLTGEGGGCVREGGAPTEEFLGVKGLAVDSGGDVYVVAGNHLYEFTAGGTEVTAPREVEAGSVGVALAGSYLYEDSAFAGLLRWEVNAGDYALENKTVIDSQGRGGVAVDPAGDVYVFHEEAEPSKSYVAEYAPGGSTLVEAIGTGEISSPGGIAYSPHGLGTLYITESTNNQVRIYARKAKTTEPKPVITSCKATKVTPVAELLSCMLTPNGEAEVHFDYGLKGHSFRETLLRTVMNPETVEEEVRDLEPANEYTFKLIAKNKVGPESGGEVTFATGPAVEGVEQCAATAETGESATVGGSTLQSADGVAAKWRFEYGLTTTYTLSTTEQTSTSFPALAEAAIGELEPNAEYDCRLVASDVYGTTEGLRGTFKTEAIPPVAAGEPATLVATRAATLVGRINPKNSPTTFHFDYGESEGYGQSTPAETAGSGLKESVVGRRVEGLRPGTTYHFRVVATNEQGMTEYGPDETFMTANENAPAVQTEPASSVTQTTATASGTVDPEGYPTTYTLEIGTSTAYGTQIAGSVGSGGEPVAISIPLQGLVAGTTYHYRFVAVNANGTSYGADQAFTTTAYSSTTSLMLTLPPAPTFVPTPVFAAVKAATTTKTLTRAQKLADALKACRKDKSKDKRKSCERAAHKRYGTHKKRKGKK